ncbi:putative transposase [Saccharopolyspora lacisalsi]|uniref:Putative transposase n=1 Tax=Halosaccharopolyspora lacisalsi TaxID=1000566 RepID=A0A839E261_9PSEU|nr:RNA-guided endonuclease TnpB family protein [Halosaccharopolyspora lacisalsi]MBA8826969.1 putative transposase [Halosaccharopolyspora lacisalsi]
MKRSYKFLLRPTTRQARALGDMLDDHRHLYNAALQERRDAYRHPSATSVRYGDQSAQLRDIRTADAEGQGRWSFSSQQATLRRLTKAFAGFFRRVKVGDKPGSPRFKGRGRFDTVEFPKDGDGCRWDSTPDDRQTRVRLQGVGHVRVHQHRPVRGRVKTVSVKREGTRWFVVLSCDEVPVEPLPETGNTAGIDMGVVHFATTSDGQHVENPRCGRRLADELAEAQRHLATSPTRKRARDRTKKHRDAARKVAKLHAKLRRQRADYHHKTALALVGSYDTSAVEDLNIAGMTRTPAPKPDPDQPGTFLPNQATAKAGLNKSILDAGWGQFLGTLADKAEKAGRRVVPVDARNTSRTCPDCGHVDGGNRVSQAEFGCQRCGYTANADVVGAANIAFRAGLVLRSAA